LGHPSAPLNYYTSSSKDVIDSMKISFEPLWGNVCEDIIRCSVNTVSVDYGAVTTRIQFKLQNEPTI